MVFSGIRASLAATLLLAVMSGCPAANAQKPLAQPASNQAGGSAQRSVGASSTQTAWKFKAPMYKRFEVTGEVVDTWCFSSRSVGEGRGPAHAACARACAHGGVTLGIVDDEGSLYIASKTKKYQGCQQLLEPLVAKRVHAKGYLAKLGGCNVMKIESVEEIGTDGKPVKQSKQK